MALHPEQAALLAAVVANPDDDLPRLVYADWLDETGDPEQAAFIRMGIEYARLPPDALRRKPMWVQIRDDGRKMGPKWLRSLGVTTASPTYVRGFAEEVEYDTPAAFFAETGSLFRFVPIQSLVISGLGGGEVGRLSRASELGRLHRLRLEGEMPSAASETWVDFFRHGCWHNLQSLSLVSCGLVDRDVIALAATPSFAALTSLDLSRNGVGVLGARAILDSPYLARLAALRFVGNFDGGGWDPDEEQVIAELYERFGDDFELGRDDPFL